MQYQSTRGHNAAVSASEAIVRGLAPDGGLYVPQEFPRPTSKPGAGSTTRSWPQRSWRCI